MWVDGLMFHWFLGYCGFCETHKFCFSADAHHPMADEIAWERQEIAAFSSDTDDSAIMILD
jgi:hypothetical protein